MMQDRAWTVFVKAINEGGDRWRTYLGQFSGDAKNVVAFSGKRQRKRRPHVRLTMQLLGEDWQALSGSRR